MNITRIIEKILIIDDDEISNQLCIDLIKKIGFADEIIIRENGKEGLNYLNSECTLDGVCPNLILLDLKMPVMDGFDFLKEFEDFHGKDKIVIVILTSSTNPDHIIKLRSTGRYYLLMKPLTLDKLVDIYHRYFRNSKR